MTIDPSDALDYDDGVSITRLQFKTKENNNIYRIGIHIADVTYFVEPGDRIDKEAQKRGITVYLAQNRCVRLLPDSLTELCSLVPNEDRYAFSVFCNIDSSGREIPTSEMKEIYNKMNENNGATTVVNDDNLPFECNSPWFGRTLVHSKGKLDYESASNLIHMSEEESKASIQNPNVILNKIDESVCVLESNNTGDVNVDINEKYRLLVKIKNDVCSLWNIAKILRDERIKLGSIQFNSKKVHFSMENDGLHVRPEYKGTSNDLIEELMLLANRLVARYLLEFSPNYTVLRRHQVPSLMNKSNPRAAKGEAKIKRAKQIAKHKS